MKHLSLKLLFTMAILALPFADALAEWVRVERVVDGDTFVTSDGTTVRVTGIDTPETKHPTKGEEAGGQEATALAKFFLEGNYVWLDGNATDKYGRRVATVQLSGGRSYADIVKAYGYDKESRSIYSFPTLTTPKATVSKNPYFISSSEMTWVDGYTRSDGTFVAGHWRKKTDTTAGFSRSYSVPLSTVSGASGYGIMSGGGEKRVYVKGYYRKDGTYVRPHYRSAPRSKK